MLRGLPSGGSRGKLIYVVESSDFNYSTSGEGRTSSLQLPRATVCSGELHATHCGVTPCSDPGRADRIGRPGTTTAASRAPAPVGWDSAGQGHPSLRPSGGTRLCPPAPRPCAPDTNSPLPPYALHKQPVKWQRRRVSPHVMLLLSPRTAPAAPSPRGARPARPGPACSSRCGYSPRLPPAARRAGTGRRVQAPSPGGGLSGGGARFSGHVGLTPRASLPGASAGAAPFLRPQTMLLS